MSELAPYFSLNEKIVSPDTPRFDPMVESNAGYLKSLINKLSEAKFLDRDTLYGVVITTPTQIKINDIEYFSCAVDILADSFDTLIDEDEAGNPFLKQKDEKVILSQYPHKTFIADKGLSLLVGDVVKVKISQIYPNHYVNIKTRYDNKIVEKTYKRITITTPKRTQDEIEKEKNIAEIFQRDLIPTEQSYKVIYTNTDFSKLTKFDPKDMIDNPDITSLFGFRTVSDEQDFHEGVDFSAAIGTDLKSPLDGYVEFIKLQAEDRSGKYVRIRYSGYSITFLHLNEIITNQGYIRKGQIIGKTGATGGVIPHLHIQMKDTSDNVLNPLFLMKGTVQVKNKGSLNLPLTESLLVDAKAGTLEKLEYSSSTPAPAVSPAQPSAVAQNAGVAKSNPTSYPKIKFINFVPDLSVALTSKFENGAKNIKLREDIFQYLTEIKTIFNKFGVPLVMQFTEHSVNSANIYDAIGSDIRLNLQSGLNKNNNPQFNDYFISPISEKYLNGLQKFNIYAKVRTELRQELDFKAETKDLEIYTVNNTYNKLPPQTIKQFGTYINLTKILEYYGFYHIEPSYEFYKFSLSEKLNWNVIRYSNKYIKGVTTLEEALLLVYEKDNSKIWTQANKKLWDGNKFI